MTAELRVSGHYYNTINFMIFKVIICKLNSNWDAQLRGPFWGTVKKEETTANQKKIKSSKFTTIIKGIKVPFHITNNNTCKTLRVAQAMSNGFIYLGEIQSTIKYWDNERQYNSAKEELYISLPKSIQHNFIYQRRWDIERLPRGKIAACNIRAEDRALIYRCLIDRN